MRVRILIFAVEIMVFLPDNWREFRVRNLVHKAPSPEKAGKYRLRMHILAMGKNDLGMKDQMQYYVILLLYFFKRNEKFPFLLLMESEQKQGLLDQYL
jgi:hypothetical protein